MLNLQNSSTLHLCLMKLDSLYTPLEAPKIAGELRSAFEREVLRLLNLDEVFDGRSVRLSRIHYKLVPTAYRYFAARVSRDILRNFDDIDLVTMESAKAQLD